jgi:hypothetical protein
MAYLVVENFSAGLDTRRHPLTARPGTLQKLKNAHVSRGGEIEKRKAFASFFDLGVNAFTQGTKGFQATSDRLYVFKKGWDYSDAHVGSNVYIQHLTHPSTLLNQGLGPDLEEITYSTLYGGKPFVIAKWSDGSVYPYFDGKVASDFFAGKLESWMLNAFGNTYSFYNLAASLAWQINGDTFGVSTTGWVADPGYTVNGAYVDVTADPGVEFTATASADYPVTVTTSTIIPFKAAVAEKPAKGSFAVSGGTPGKVAAAAKQLRLISSMPKVMNIYFDGQKAIDEPGGWTGFDHNTVIGNTGNWNLGPRIAYNFDYFLANYSRNRPGFTSAPIGDATYSIQGVDGGIDIGTLTMFVPNTTGDYFDDHDQNNGKTIEIEFNSDPNSHNHISELITLSTVVPSPYTPGRFIARFGLMTGGQTNAITSVKVDGTEILGSPVKWMHSNADTMTQIVKRITDYASTPEYAAAVEDGRISLYAPAGSGVNGNGRIITVLGLGDVTTANYSTFSGGADAAPAIQQRVRYTIEGSFSVGSTIQLVATKTIDPSSPVYWGRSRVTGTTPVSALTFKTKAHVTSGSSLFFSGVNQPKEWGEDGVGAGFINMSNNNGGNEVLTGLALYQGQLAAFARRSVQVWSIDPDPANNRQGQVLSNTGALGQKSIVSVGEIDVFYLSDSGVRSLRARDSSNSAVVNDVGTPIDNLVLSDISGLTETQKTACPAVIEPIDGRYWIAIGQKVYVFSYFPNSQVAAWSTYEPGFAIENFTTKDGRVYARSGDNIYLYGGSTGSEYDDAEVEVVLPYLDGGKPAHTKTLMGLDMTVEGDWQTFIGMDPISVEARDNCGTVTQPTFSLGRVQANGIGTHIGIKMVSQSSGYSRLANLICHFEFNESD